MIPFQERKKVRKIMYSKVSLAVLFFVLVAVGKGSWDVYQKALVAKTERNIAMRSLADLQTRTTELESSLSHLKTEQGIETEVRQKYSVALPAEEVVVIIDDNEKKGKNGDAVRRTGFWNQFLSFFGF